MQEGGQRGQAGTSPTGGINPCPPILDRRVPLRKKEILYYELIPLHILVFQSGKPSGRISKKSAGSVEYKAVFVSRDVQEKRVFSGSIVKYLCP